MNPLFELYPAEYCWISGHRQHDNMVAINSAVEVDLTVKSELNPLEPFAEWRRWTDGLCYRSNFPKVDAALP